MIELTLLGSPQIRLNGKPVILKAGKCHALLAYLALTNAAHPRTHLMNLLWANSDDSAARKNLRNHLSLIRNVLGNDSLLIDDDFVGLADHVVTDAVRFALLLTRQLQTPNTPTAAFAQTLDGWHGTLLADLHISEAPAFDIWLLGERERMGQLYSQGLLRLAELHHAAAAWTEVVTTAQRALKHDNTQENMARLLMEAYARQDQKTHALKVYEQLRTVLIDELAVEPLPETNALRAAILQGRLGGATSSAIASAAPGVLSVASSAEGDTPLFVGRRDELNRLNNCFRHLQQSQMQVVLIRGALGVGKTALWQAWSKTLPATTTRLETVCLNTIQPLPFGPIVRLFNRHTVRERLVTQLSQLTPGWLSLVTRLLPTLAPDQAVPSAPATFANQLEPTQLFEGLAQLLQSYLSQPLLLFLDDLHWADQTTLDWLTYLMTTMDDKPLLLAVAYRPEDSTAPMNRSLAHWARLGHVTYIELAGLPLAESREMISALAVGAQNGDTRNSYTQNGGTQNGDTQTVNALYAQSGGNPYVLIQLLQSTTGRLSVDLTEIMLARIHQLPDNTQQVLQAAAVLEPTINFVLLQRLCKRSEEETIDAIDLLLTKAILCEEESNYVFVQPYLAQILRSSLSTTRRRFLHRQAAAQLELLYTNQPGAVAAQLMRHHAAAEQLSSAARFAELAGHQAFDVGAMQEALPFFEQAYGYEATAGRLLAWGWVLTYLPGKLTQGRQLIEQAYHQAKDEGGFEQTVDAAIKLAFSHLYSGEGERTLHWAQAAERHCLVGGTLEGDLATHWRCRIHFVLGGAHLRLGDLTQAEAHLIEATTLATQEHCLDIATILSWGDRGLLHLQRGEYGKAQSMYQQMLHSAQVANDLYHQVLSYNQLAHTARLLNALPTALQQVEHGIALAHNYAVMRPRQFLYSTRGEIALQQGDTTTAVHWFEQALAEAEKYDNQPFTLELQDRLKSLRLASLVLPQNDFNMNEALNTQDKTIEQYRADGLKLAQG